MFVVVVVVVVVVVFVVVFVSLELQANHNQDVLRTLESAGLGFDCVSLQEVERILGLFPQLDPTRILFTANFAPRVEYERVFQLGACMTVDNP